MDHSAERVSPSGRSTTAGQSSASATATDESFQDVGFEDYLREGPLQALDVIEEITGAKR